MIFASYNIQYGTGRDGRVDLARVAAAVAYADVVALQEVERRLTESVRRHLMSDVPLGALLSGGVDSSVVAATAGRASCRRLNCIVDVKPV